MGMGWAWLLPAICVGAFLAIALFRRALPFQGAFLAVAAIVGSFVLFWPIMADAVRSGPGGPHCPRTPRTSRSCPASRGGGGSGTHRLI